MANASERLWRAMTRRKKLETDDMDTKLNRCLNALDLTLLGIGNMAGSGIYVLTGTVIRTKSGPAVFISFLIAGVVAFLNALCYAELGSRIPKAGSAYTYTYIAGGEFLAFVIGWSVVLEYVLSVASVARGWSGTVDSMLGGVISNHTKMYLFKNYNPPQWFGDYPDLVAFGIVILLGMILATGPKMSANFNSVITSINILVILFTTGILITHPYAKNGNFFPEEHGGFEPFGFAGILAGAGTCFYSFIGFDAITVSSEEASNPKKDLPIASALSVGFVTVLFVVGTLALVLFMPWYHVDPNAAFTYALGYRGFRWATYITGIGSLLGISASLFTSMYAMPRIVYSMAIDGLLPRWLGYIQPHTQIPLIALIIFGLLAGFLALMFSIETLADFLSIGTLMAYTIVCANLCILRYRSIDLDVPHVGHAFTDDLPGYPSGGIEEPDKSKDGVEEFDVSSIGVLKPNYRGFPVIGKASSGSIPLLALLFVVIFSTSVCCLALLGTDYLRDKSVWAILLLCVSILGLFMSISVMAMHQQNELLEGFKVPLVPWTPCFTILLNICLIVKLSPMTWLRFGVWTLFGILIYFGYGIWHSTERHADDETGLLLKQPQSDIDEGKPATALEGSIPPNYSSTD